MTAFQIRRGCKDTNGMLAAAAAVTPQQQQQQQRSCSSNAFCECCLQQCLIGGLSVQINYRQRAINDLQIITVGH